MVGMAIDGVYENTFSTGVFFDVRDEFDSNVISKDSFAVFSTPNTMNHNFDVAHSNENEWHEIIIFWLKPEGWACSSPGWSRGLLIFPTKAVRSIPFLKELNKVKSNLAR